LLLRSKLNTTQALEAIEARGFQSPHVKVLVEFIKTSERGVRNNRASESCQLSVVSCPLPVVYFGGLPISQSDLQRTTDSL